MAVDTAARLVGPAALTGTPDTLYTAPADGHAILRNIHAVNPDPVVEALFTMSLGTDAPENRIFHTIIPPYGTLDWSGFMVVIGSEILQAAALTGTITLTASGVEVTP